MIQVDDLSRSLIAFEQISTLVIVVELSQSSWLAAGVVPGIERRPLKKLDPDPTALLHLVEGWRDRATKAGRAITRTFLAFESGRDGFWLARWLRVRGVETFVMHSTSVAVSREPRRAKTDRLDTEMLIRVFLGWLRGEPRHCKMVAIPTLEEEDARRPSREREILVGEDSCSPSGAHYTGCLSSLTPPSEFPIDGFASADATTRTQDAAIQIAWISPTIPVRSRRRSQHLQRPAPSHVPRHAPTPQRQSVPDVASRDV